MGYQPSGALLTLRGSCSTPTVIGLLAVLAVFLAQGPRTAVCMPERVAQSPVPEPNCRSGGTLKPLECEPGSFCVYVTRRGSTPAESDTSTLGYCMNEASRERVCIVGGAVDQVSCPRGSKCKISIAGNAQGLASIGLCTAVEPTSEGVPLGGVCGHGGFVFPPAPFLFCQDGLRCELPSRCNPDVPCYGKCVLSDETFDSMAPGPEPAPAPADDPGAAPSLVPGSAEAPDPADQPKPPIETLANSCVFGGGRRPKWCPKNSTCVPQIRGSRFRPSVGVCIPTNVAGSFCVVGGNVPQIPCAPEQQCLPLVPGTGSYATVGICQTFKPAPGTLGNSCRYSPSVPTRATCAIGLRCKATLPCGFEETECEGVCVRRPATYIPLGQRCQHSILNILSPPRKCAPGLRCSRSPTCARGRVCFGVCEPAVTECREGGNVKPVACGPTSTCVFVTSGGGDLSSRGYCMPSSRLGSTCVFGGEVDEVSCESGLKCVPTIPGGPGEATIGVCQNLTA